jgi:hypothetical protein
MKLKFIISTLFLAFCSQAFSTSCWEMDYGRFCQGDEILIDCYHSGISEKMILEEVGIYEKLGWRYFKGLIPSREKLAQVSCYKFLIKEGSVPGFDNLRFGEETPNAYGSYDIIEALQTTGTKSENDKYVVRKGESGAISVLNPKELSFRISAVKEKKVSVQLKDYGRMGNSTSEIRSTIVSDIEKKLIHECAIFFTKGHFKLVDTKIELRNFKTKRIPRSAMVNEKLEGGADIRASANCVVAN